MQHEIDLAFSIFEKYYYFVVIVIYKIEYSKVTNVEDDFGLEMELITI